MLSYIGKRLLIMIPVALAITLIVFTIVNTTADSTARLMLGSEASQESIDKLNHELGLDKPFAQRYVEFVKGILTGDLGTSYRSKTPVANDIALRFPTTFKLAVFGILLAVAVGVPIGALSALKQYSLIDNISLVSGLVLASIPSFWLGLMLILQFAVKLGWFPATGAGSFIHYVLPAITVSTMTMATLIRMTRSTMLEVIRQDYIRTARAKGVPEHDIVIRHVLKNSLLPIITVIGINFGALLGGTIIVESVFAIPGIGTLILDAINMKDTPVVMAGVTLLAILFSVINLVVDLLYAFIDPRIRSTFAAKRG